MPRLSLYRPHKGNDYKFFDKVIAEQFVVGSTDIYVHKYLGPQQLGVTDDPSQPNTLATTGQTSETDIQDVLNLEIRDRKYDPNVFVLRGSYNLSDTEFELGQFGIFLSSDTVFITFHLNNMLDSLGRKLMPGDVLELPHQRDDAVLGYEGGINRFYVVQEGMRPAEGYSPTWYPHLWRVKCDPLTDSQEFRQILEESQGIDSTGKEITLKDLISTYDKEIGISDQIVQAAEEAVPYRNFQTAHLYVVPGTELGNAYPWIFAGDGAPPNGAKLVGSGYDFPTDPIDGDYFLRTDYIPNVLYKRESNKWVRQEVDYRQKWSAANRILHSFINNTNITTIGNESFKEQQNLREAIKPRIDPDLPKQI